MNEVDLHNIMFTYKQRNQGTEERHYSPVHSQGTKERQQPGTQSRYRREALQPGTQSSYKREALQPGTQSRYKIEALQPGTHSRYNREALQPGTHSRYKRRGTTARYTLSTKLNSTRSTLLKVDEVDLVALTPYTLVTKSTVSATVDFVADLLPVLATVNFVTSV